MSWNYKHTKSVQIKSCIAHVKNNICQHEGWSQSVAYISIEWNKL